MGITAVSPSVCVAAKGADSWVETLHTGGTLWDEVREGSFERLFEGHVLLHNGHGADANLHIPSEGAVLRRAPAPGAEASVYLALPPGYLAGSLQFTDKEWAEIAAWQRSKDKLSHALAGRLLEAGLLDV
jgi:hypothetical protein